MHTCTLQLIKLNIIMRDSKNDCSIAMVDGRNYFRFVLTGVHDFMINITTVPCHVLGQEWVNFSFLKKLIYTANVKFSGTLRIIFCQWITVRSVKRVILCIFILMSGNRDGILLFEMI